MPARPLPLIFIGKGTATKSAGMHRDSQETGFVVAHQPRSRGGTEEFTFMYAPTRRTAVPPVFRLLVAIAIALASIPANAVIVRGAVTDPLGAAIPGAHVALIQGNENAGSAITG